MYPCKERKTTLIHAEKGIQHIPMHLSLHRNTTYLPQQRKEHLSMQKREYNTYLCRGRNKTITLACILATDGKEHLPQERKEYNTYPCTYPCKGIQYTYPSGGRNATLIHALTLQKARTQLLWLTLAVPVASSSSFLRLATWLGAKLLLWNMEVKTASFNPTDGLRSRLYGSKYHSVS